MRTRSEWFLESRGGSLELGAVKNTGRPPLNLTTSPVASHTSSNNGNENNESFNSDDQHESSTRKMSLSTQDAVDSTRKRHCTKNNHVMSVAEDKHDRMLHIVIRILECLF